MRSPDIHLHEAHVFGALADLDFRQGRLREAAAYWQSAFAAIHDPENWGHVPLPVIGWVYVRMSEILCEWNELAEARNQLRRGLERVEAGGDAEALLAAYLVAARLSLAESDVSTAAEYLRRARPVVDQTVLPEWAGVFERCQLGLWLAQDKPKAAVDWAAEILQLGPGEARQESEQVQLAAARALILKGEPGLVEGALRALGRLHAWAEQEGRMGILIETLTLESLGHWRRGDHAGAMVYLERGLRLAEPEGYVRLFVDLGVPAIPLLQEAQSRNILPGYAGKLLSASGAGLAPGAIHGEGPAEQLSHREEEILRLVAAGLTNREIADKLIISPETVKKHTAAIYSKLRVGNRTEAAAKARELDLLESRRHTSDSTW